MNSQAARIGAFLCHCGGNISDVIDMEQLESFAQGLEDVVHVRSHENICSQEGQQQITDEIEQFGLTGAVVACCSPHFHEREFQEALKESPISPYQLEIANIREQGSWVHYDEPENALAKAQAQIAGKVEKVKLNEPLEPFSVPIGDKVLVIGAGIAGIQAALDLADTGFQVYVVEKQPYIGGRMGQLGRTFPTLDCAPCILDPKMSDVMSNENITVYTYTEITRISGFITNYEVDLRIKPRYVTDTCTNCGECSKICPVELENEFDFGIGTRNAAYITHPEAVPMQYLIDIERCLQPPRPPCARVCPVDAIDFAMEEQRATLHVDTIIVATGFDLYDMGKIAEYHYGESDNILHAGHIERMILGTGPTDGKILRPSDQKQPRSVAWILCSGSRDEHHKEYCSQICCMYSMKQAMILRSKLGEDARLTIFYTDIRAAGKGFEEFYNDVRKKNVEFIRGRPSDIYPIDGGEHVLVRATDTTMGEILEEEYDLVVLSPAILPSQGTLEMSSLLKIPRSSDGFLKESHLKFKPVDTQVEGVFLAGTAQGPKDIPGAVMQGGAAAARVARLLNNETVEIDPIAVEVDLGRCDGCQEFESKQCIDACPFDAITPSNGQVEINPLLCKGCGLCLGYCHAGALEVRNYRTSQVLAEVRGLLEHAPPPRLIAFFDDTCSYVAIDLLSNRRQLYTSHILPVRIPDGVMATPNWILETFQMGAEGVFVGTCEAGSDPYAPQCAEIAQENIKVAREQLQKQGIDPQRLSFQLAVTGDPAPVLATLESLDAFIEKTMAVSLE